MKIMQVEAKLGRVDSVVTDALVLLHCEGEQLAEQNGALLDNALGGALRELLQSKEFEGKSNEVVLFHTQKNIPAKRVIFIGLGKKSDLRLDHIRQAMGYAAKRVRQAKATSFTVAFPTTIPQAVSATDVAQAMAEGAILGSYQFTAYWSDAPRGKDVTGMTVLAPQKEHLRARLPVN